MGPGIKQCFLCGRKRSNEIALHKFPKNINIRAAWVAFCNLNEDVDNVTNLEICSTHFTPDSYCEPKAKALGNLLRLKPGSIPTILKPSDIEKTRLELETKGQPSSKEVDEISAGPSSEVTDLHTPPLEEGEQTPKRPRFSSPRHVGEIRTPHLETPRRAKRCLNLAKRKIFQQTRKIKTLQQKNRRLTNRVRTLKDLLGHLKKKNLISENAEECIMTSLPDNIQSLISRKVKSRGKYSPELRKFALTLQFYSTAAYEYVRKTWLNLLPHPSTLRKWYSVVDGRPGFSKEALSAISLKNNVSPVFLNLVLDEMSIRSQIIFDNGQFYGGVDLGSTLSKDTDNIREATNALVFLAVGINGHWKVPLGYFLIDGLSGSERANLLVKCFELVKETGAHIFSVTFDGAPVNLSMCTHLGANFNYFSNEFKPWFINPSTNDKVFIFFDACHMLKLVRNTLGDKKILIDDDNNTIKWQFIEELLQLQQDEGLHAATKLTKKHVNFCDNRMNVKLAAQTLSERVYSAFLFVTELQLPQFEGCIPTAKFCLTFNNIFDVLNCRNKFSKKNKFNIPVDEKSFDFLYSNSKKFEEYIINLKDNSGIPILKTNRKTGFLGFIICLRNIFELYKRLKDFHIDYLLSYKLSQDHIETFFSAIRSRGGFNNNPNARQFESAYKRLLVRHEISTTYTNSNCLADGIEILSVSSKKRNLTDSIVDPEEKIQYDLFDHDYVSTLWTLTPYVENVIQYIAGFIVHKILKDKTMCHICSNLLTDKVEAPLLIKIKNRGKLMFPSKEVCRICFIAERVFRQNLHILFIKKNIKQYLISQTFRNVSSPFDCEEMKNHILSHDILDNHRSQLTKLVIETFLSIRLYHEAKVRSQKDESIRHRYTKLILFKNQ